MKFWEKFSKEQLAEFVRESRTYAEVARRCGCKYPYGSVTQSLMEMVDKYQLDTSHFVGQAWNKDNYDFDRFTDHSHIGSATRLKALISIRGHECELCHNTMWQGYPIKLEVHHLDGNSLNNRLDNLQLLCPNCHSCTDNWRGRNRAQQKCVSDEELVKALREEANIRRALIRVGLSPRGANYKRARMLILKYKL